MALGTLRGRRGGRGRELARRGCAARNQLCKPISPRRLDAYFESKKCNLTIKVTDWSMGSESEIDQAVASLFFISTPTQTLSSPTARYYVRDPTRAPSFDVHRPYRICTRVRTPRRQHIHPHISASRTRARPHPNGTRRLRLVIHRHDARRRSSFVEALLLRCHGQGPAGLDGRQPLRAEVAR